MSISSQQTDYLTISSNGSGYSTDTITVTPSIPTIDTFDLSSLTVGSIDLSNTMYNSGTISIGPLTTSDISIYGYGEDWKDQFPNWDQVKDMCDKYPGLKIAFDKFKTVYKLVKDDYDAAKDSD